MWVAGMVLGIIGLVFTLFGIGFGSFGLVRRRRTQTWVDATGTIVVGPTLMGLPVSRFPIFRFYDDSEREHEIVSRVRTWPRLEPGTRVDVRYYPKSPERAIITSGEQGHRTFLILGGVLGGIGLLLLVAAGWIWLAT